MYEKGEIFKSLEDGIFPDSLKECLEILPYIISMLMNKSDLNDNNTEIEKYVDALFSLKKLNFDELFQKGSIIYNNPDLLSNIENMETIEKDITLLIIEILKLQAYVNEYENQKQNVTKDNNVINGRANSSRFSHSRNSPNISNNLPLNYFKSTILDLKAIKSNNQILFYQLLYMMCYCLNNYFKIEVIVDIFCYMENGIEFIIQYIENTPWNFFKAIEQCCVLFKLKPELQSSINSILIEMYQMAPHHSIAIRNILVEKRILPNIILAITKDIIHDELTFINSVLGKNSKWFIQDKQCSKYINWIRKRMKKEIYTQMSVNSDSIDIYIPFRIICGLAGLINKFHFNSDELNLYLNVVRQSHNHRLAQLSLCFMLICWDQISSYSKEALIELMGDLLRSEYSEMTLMLGVYSHTNQMFEIVHLVRNILRIDIDIPKTSLPGMRYLITQTLINESEITKRSLYLPKTKMTKNENFSFMIVYKLLRGKVFQKGNVDIKDWITYQILNISLPIHYLIQPILKEYIEGILTTPSITKIPEELVYNHLKHINEFPQPSQIVLLFYVLMFNEIIQQYPHHSLISEYETKFLENIPIKYILQYVENKKEFSTIYPSFVKCIAYQFPHLYNTTNNIMEEEIEQNSSLITPYFRKVDIVNSINNSVNDSTAMIIDNEDIKLDPDNIKKNLLQPGSDDKMILLALRYINSLKIHQKIPYCESVLSTVIPRILEKNDDDILIVNEFVEIWKSLNTVIPNKLWVATLNYFQKEKRGADYTYQDLIENPMILFTCDQRVYQNPKLLEIFLLILEFVMVASRHYYRHEYNTYLARGNINNNMFRDMHLSTLLYIQETSLFQTLIEISQMESKKTKDEKHKEVILSLIFNFINQRFIENPKYIKLIHFQTYAVEIIPNMVKYVPSMHVCFDFIPELLSLNNVENQVFGIQLSGFVFMKYPVARSHALAKDVVIPKIKFMALPLIDFSSHIQNQMNNELSLNTLGTIIESIPDYLVEVIPVLINICKAFPNLIHSVSELLHSMKPVKDSQFKSVVINNAVAFKQSKANLLFQIANVISETTIEIASLIKNENQNMKKNR
ncbi:hypothetical protein H8356DRAFT_1426165 [Neocallimastix lanati (nom. inval.)]|jgi:hypothetical protein|uniref:Integrator complex subunit 2 n=1 Tax=Neocallimastix californiae TaxID=1754190 RepID=A0A1Y2DZI8_9FUNG|nr:hypothetical protein H8356DRAFT_1426165 [Neocallimastix sp. JGI-2020a]ORY64657.1 hypothetical protein LY90DRAFT_668041 [Neocallimastix californiae]|eukprot:ORY64657.1 hypothetical protein LY90DRAFT_668041 [Neocallimastix californiae]